MWRLNGSNSNKMCLCKTKSNYSILQYLSVLCGEALGSAFRLYLLGVCHTGNTTGKEHARQWLHCPAAEVVRNPADRVVLVQPGQQRHQQGHSVISTEGLGGV